MTVSTLGPISPADVHAVLARHTLADGYDLVLDFERSHGAWLHDARSGREYLDFCMFFASNPIGYNHPKMKDPEFLEVLHRVAQLKPSLSDFYSVEYASFVDTFGRSRCPRTCATPSSSRAARSASRTRSRRPSTGRCARTARRGSRARRASR